MTPDEARASLYAMAADSASRRGDHHRAAQYLTRAIGIDPRPAYDAALRWVQWLDAGDTDQRLRETLDHHTARMAQVT